MNKIKPLKNMEFIEKDIQIIEYFGIAVVFGKLNYISKLLGADR